MAEADEYVIHDDGSGLRWDWANVVMFMCPYSVTRNDIVVALAPTRRAARRAARRALREGKHRRGAGSC